MSATISYLRKGRKLRATGYIADKSNGLVTDFLAVPSTVLFHAEFGRRK